MRSPNGTLYAERRMTLTSGVYKEGSLIVIGERVWDGIDRPDYTPLVTLSADEARYIGQELLKLAEKVDGRGKKDRTYAKVKKNTLDIARAARVEAEL